MMSTQLKIYVTALASFVAGLLISFHVGDPSQQNTISGDINTIFGGLLDVGSAFYALETLLVKHKAEVADQHFLTDVPEPPVTPATDPNMPIVPVV